MLIELIKHVLTPELLYFELSGKIVIFECFIWIIQITGRTALPNLVPSGPLQKVIWIENATLMTFSVHIFIFKSKRYPPRLVVCNICLIETNVWHSWKKRNASNKITYVQVMTQIIWNKFFAILLENFR